MKKKIKKKTKKKGGQAAPNAARGRRRPNLIQQVSFNPAAPRDAVD
ncbi:hypothetical protein [Bradyrhizobium diazoefficiens]|nr:hypothetical protein [Bradyrhizobium japonicum]